MFGYRALIIGVLMLLAALPAQAGPLGSEAIDLDRAVQRNPRKAAAEAQLLLQQTTRHDSKQVQLNGLRILANAHSLLGNMFVIGEDIDRGEQLARELNNPQASVEFVIAAANDAQLAGQFTKASKKYADALQLSQKARLPLAVAMSYASLVNAALDRGLKSNVVVYATKAYDLFEAQGDLRGMAQMLSALGINSNDPARTVEYLERAGDLCDPAVYRWDAAQTYYQLGIALYRNRDYTKARVRLEKAIALGIDLAVPLNVAYAEVALGRIDFAERQFESALSHWNRSLPILAQNNDLQAMLETQRFRAAAFAGLQRPNDRASALVEAAAAGSAIRQIESRGKAVPRLSRLAAPWRDGRTPYSDFSVEIDNRRTAEGGGPPSAMVAEAQFDAKIRETENALLKEQQKRAELERVTLVLALISSFAAIVLVVFLLIRQIRQKHRFASLAMRDELTGLRNRRSILEFARVQFGLQRTLSTRLFVALLDLDHFKQVNDEFGHDVGDAVLIAFANACQRQLRSNHVFGRFGGEEFLLIMPDTREDQVFDIFERLREVISELHVAGLPLARRLSFSMGSAEVRADSSSLESLIKEADLALYRAKEKGRDRCEIHLGGLQATYDANVARARPVGHAPKTYDPTSRSPGIRAV